MNQTGFFLKACLYVESSRVHKFVAKMDGIRKNIYTLTK